MTDNQTDFETLNNIIPPATIAPTPIPPGLEGLPTTRQFSDARPFWYVAVMMIGTFGLYRFVWFYRAWRLLISHYQLRGNAVFNALLAPLCIWSFFRYAFLLGADAGFIAPIAGEINASFYFLIFIASCLSPKTHLYFHGYALSLPIFSVLILLRLVSMQQPVIAMNAGYRFIDPQYRERTGFSFWSIISLIIGLLCWASFIVNWLSKTKT